MKARICPKCENQNPADARKCKACGKPVGLDTNSLFYIPQILTGSMFFCMIFGGLFGMFFSAEALAQGLMLLVGLIFLIVGFYLYEK